jgi:hypothetical protein
MEVRARKQTRRAAHLSLRGMGAGKEALGHVGRDATVHPPVCMDFAGKWFRLAGPFCCS